MAHENIRWSLHQILSSAFIAVAVWSAVGFDWFGYGMHWVTPAGAQRMTSRLVTENLAGICVAQARRAADADAAIAHFTGLDTWKRHEFLQSTGWGVMPGSRSPRIGVLERCAEKLLRLPGGTAPRTTAGPRV